LKVFSNDKEVFAFDLSYVYCVNLLFILCYLVDVTAGNKGLTFRVPVSS